MHQSDLGHMCQKSLYMLLGFAELHSLTALCLRNKQDPAGMK